MYINKEQRYITLGGVGGGHGDPGSYISLLNRRFTFDERFVNEGIFRPYRSH